MPVRVRKSNKDSNTNNNTNNNSNTITVYRAVKFRLYPTKEQGVYLAQCFGCRRFIYNHILAMWIDFHAEQKKLPEDQRTNFDFDKALDDLRKEFPFLMQVSCWIRNNTLRDLRKAFKNHFKNKADFGFPRFKSKKNERLYASCTFNNSDKNAKNISLDYEKGTIRFPGWQDLKDKDFVVFKAKLHRQIRKDAIIVSATVSREANGKYYVSVMYKYEIQAPVHQKPVKVIGFDYSQADGAILSNGEDFGTPHAYLQAIEEIAKWDKILARRHKGSKRYEKARVRRANVFAKIRHITENFNHQLSLKIAREYDIASFEDLDLRALAKKKVGRFGKKIMDNAFGKFKTYVKYKMEERGKWYIEVAKNFPSTQLCSNCGYQNHDLAGKENLGIREWTCPECGAVHNRDLNAAVNIANEGLRKAKAQYDSIH